jgi:hypothetical protein
MKKKDTEIADPMKRFLRWMLPFQYITQNTTTQDIYLNILVIAETKQIDMVKIITAKDSQTLPKNSPLKQQDNISKTVGI